MDVFPTTHEIAGRYLSMYEGFYKEVDPQYKGVIKAQTAAGFLKRSNLTNTVLGKVWEIADKGCQGFLDKLGFFVALKLIACVQNGLEPSVSNLRAEIPPPVVASQAESPSLPAFGSTMSSDLATEWAVKPKELTKYDEIFNSLGPLNGKLTGEQVKPVLLNSGLPTDLLGKIWELSDIDKDGLLDHDEMCVALHLVYRALENEPVPTALPPVMIPPSKRRSSLTSVSQQGRRPTLPGGVKVLPPQSSLNRRSRASSITSIESVGLPAAPQSPRANARSLSGTPIPATTIRPPAPWVVDKFKYERMFNDADLDQDGLVSGGDVKGIFLQTGLAQAYLAHIWNLCDINSTGSLNLEQFALAMFFVEQKRQNNVEPPAELSPDLVPPSFRPNPAGMTDIATNTSHDSTEMSSMAKMSGNKEIDQVLSEIADLQKEKRQIEQNVMQLETDMTVKQSEIRNLEMELNTLVSTVQQLERQKGEAQKRLDSLEEQKMSIFGMLNDIRQKNEDDNERIVKMRSEVESTVIALQNEEAERSEKQQELQKMHDEEMQLKSKLMTQQAKLQGINQAQLSSEHVVEESNRIVKQLRDQRINLVEKLAKLEAVLGATDDVELLNIDPSLLAADEEEALNKILGTKEHAVPSFGNEQPFQMSSNASAYDPFRTVDPFVCGGGDPFVHVDPFSAQPPVEDPFASSKDPFSAFGASQPLTVEGGPKKAPPRPAPPSSRPVSTTVKSASDPFAGQGTVEDPFGGSTTTSDSSGFANFADFSKFS